MQTQETSAGSTAAYDAKPWLHQYPPDVPATLTYPEQTTWELLEQTVEQFGAKTAFIFQDRGMSFAQLRDYAIQFSGGLSDVGVKKDDVVLLLLPNVPHFPVTYYAAARVGVVIAAAPPNSVEREIEGLIRDSGARTIVTLDVLYEKIANTWQQAGVERLIVGTVTDFMSPLVGLLGRVTGKIPKPKVKVPYGSTVKPMRPLLRSRIQAPAAGVSSDDVALLQYTGGTTGTPKAAMLTHRSLLANAHQMVSWFPSLKRGEETMMAVLPFFHVYGVTLVMNAGMLLAAQTVLIARPAMADIFAAIARYRPSIFPGVPTLYVAVVNDARSREFDLSSIDVCVSGGAPLPLEVKKKFEKITGGHLYEGYGLSEASPCTHAEPCDGRSKVGSMGLPLADTDVRIVDEAGHAVPIDGEGELMVRGPQVMRGYWRRPEETAEVLKDGWLLTGDIARMDAEGWFYIVDRKKDLIITGGENIYPREVEEVLFEHPAVQEAAVVGVPHPYGGEIAKAFLVLKPGETATKQDITRFASERLSRHKVPRSIEFREELPKSPAQKILRRVLAEEERQRQDARPRRRKT